MHKRIMQVTVTAILAALICVATMIVQIPIPATGGYANLGDGIILISSFLLPVGCSITAAALGSALADLLLGYVAFIPGTLMIKAFMAFLSWLVLHSFHQVETDRKAICTMIFFGNCIGSVYGDCILWIRSRYHGHRAWRSSRHPGEHWTGNMWNHRIMHPDTGSFKNPCVWSVG